MMKRLIYIWLMLAPLAGALAHDGKGRDDPKYPVSDIAPELLEDAHLVIRKSEELFTIKSIGETVYRQHYVYTILNDKADPLRQVSVYFDNETSKVEEFEAWVYDAKGEEVDKMKKSEIKEQSYVQGGNLFDGIRLMYSNLTKPDYPYTIEVITEKTYYGTLNMPQFAPQWSENISVESSSYTILAPSDLKPRYRENNFDGEFTEKIEADIVKMEWRVSNLQTVETEPLSWGIREVVPIVEFAPNKFKYGGYEGDMSTWKSFGEYFWQLNEGRDKISAKTAQEIDRITQGLSNREKIKVVYEYMQNRTRYVSIQLGIGGLQPFEALMVDEVGYGDCKALTNYTYSLLKSVGIKSYYSLIEAGMYPDPVSPDFTVDPFNHVILCVPTESDTVWLECTSQKNPFNYLGTFTSDRSTLLITENGGKLVRTPRYKLSDNLRSRNVQVKFDESGNALIFESTAYKGLHYSTSYLNQVVDQGDEIKKKWARKYTDLANFDLESINIKDVKTELPQAVVKMKMTSQKYASRTGKRFYFQPNLMSHVEDSFKPVEDRKSPFSIKYPLAFVDTIVYDFPSSFQVEYLQEPVSIETEFGNYSSHVQFVQGRLTYFRRLELSYGEYSPDKYDDFIEFIEKVKDADKSKVVFTTKT